MLGRAATSFSPPPAHDEQRAQSEFDERQDAGEGGPFADEADPAFPPERPATRIEHEQAAFDDPPEPDQTEK